MAEAKANGTTTRPTTDMTTDTAAGAIAGGAVGVDPARVVQVDPGRLLVDVSVRRETVTDKEFVASVRQFGILQPILAVRTAEGELRVRMGHRRTLAAVELGLATVPVIVVADERTDKTGEIERLLSQFHENEHRTGLATTDRLGVVEQLSLLNVSAAQIAKRSGMKRPQVDQALAVTKSDLAKAASERYELTLDQAAAVAEFDDGAETVKALVVAAATGQFPHVLERARQDRADVEQRTHVEQELAATGVRVIDAPDFRDLTGHRCCEHGADRHRREQQPSLERTVAPHLLEVQRQHVQPPDADHRLQPDGGVGRQHRGDAHHIRWHERRGVSGFYDREQGQQRKSRGCCEHYLG